MSSRNRIRWHQIKTRRHFFFFWWTVQNAVESGEINIRWRTRSLKGRTRFFWQAIGINRRRHGSFCAPSESWPPFFSCVVGCARSELISLFLFLLLPAPSSCRNIWLDLQWPTFSLRRSAFYFVSVEIWRYSNRESHLRRATPPARGRPPFIWFLLMFDAGKRGVFCCCCCCCCWLLYGRHTPVGVFDLGAAAVRPISGCSRRHLQPVTQGFLPRLLTEFSCCFLFSGSAE